MKTLKEPIIGAVTETIKSPIIGTVTKKFSVLVIFPTQESAERNLSQTISLACNYNTSYDYDCDEFMFLAKCNTQEDMLNLSEDLTEYFFAK